MSFSKGFLSQNDRAMNKLENYIEPDRVLKGRQACITNIKNVKL